MFDKIRRRILKCARRPAAGHAPSPITNEYYIMQNTTLQHRSRKCAAPEEVRAGPAAFLSKNLERVVYVCTREKRFVSQHVRGRAGFGSGC